MAFRKLALRQMLADARTRVDLPVQRQIDDVTLQVTQERGGTVILRLELDVAPTDELWPALLAAWPESLPEHRAVPVTRREHGRWVSVLRYARPQTPEIPA